MTVTGSNPALRCLGLVTDPLTRQFVYSRSQIRSQRYKFKSCFLVQRQKFAQILSLSMRQSLDASEKIHRTFEHSNTFRRPSVLRNVGGIWRNRRGRHNYVECEGCCQLLGNIFRRKFYKLSASDSNAAAASWHLCRDSNSSRWWCLQTSWCRRFGFQFHPHGNVLVVNIVG